MYYNSEWMDAVQTNNAPLTKLSGPEGGDRGDDKGGGGSTGKDYEILEVYCCNFLEC